MWKFSRCAVEGQTTWYCYTETETLSKSDNTSNQSWPQIYTDGSTNRDITTRDMKWLYCCQWLNAILIPIQKTVSIIFR